MSGTLQRWCVRSSRGLRGCEEDEASQACMSDFYGPSLERKYLYRAEPAGTTRGIIVEDAGVHCCVSSRSSCSIEVIDRFKATTPWPCGRGIESGGTQYR